MDLNACKECGKDVSRDDQLCPFCGVRSPVNGQILSKGIFVGIVILIIVALFLLNIDTSKPVEKDASSTTTKVATEVLQAPIKVESIVTFPNGIIACVDRDVLKKVLELGINNQTTKMNSYFIENHGENANCLMLSKDQKFKVIGVEYNDAKFPDMGILEIVGSKIQSADQGAFVFVAGSDLVHVVR